MARSRNIKPGFFKNYDLADAGPSVQLLFAGLWCLADREGRLEDKPRFIKAELFPYYDFDVNDGLTELERLKFICRYLADDVAVIQVLNFNKHQSPHKTEKASNIPCIELSKKGSNLKSIGCIGIGATTVNPSLGNDGNLPDSLLLIPDSLLLIPEKKEVAVAPCNSLDIEKKIITPKKPKTEKTLTEADLLRNAGIDGQLADDFLKIRKVKRAPLTQTSLDGLEREACIAEISVVDAVRICVERNWQSFKAEWITNNSAGKNNGNYGNGNITKEQWNSLDF